MLIRKVVIRRVRTPKNIFPSTFRRDIGRKFVIPFDYISFGIQIPLARHHSCGTIAFFQACWRRTVSFLRTRGQFLYNLYDIPFKPRALPARTLWTKSQTSFSFISRYHQTLPLDLGVLVNLLEEVLGYRLNHLSIPVKFFCSCWFISMLLFILFGCFLRWEVSGYTAAVLWGVASRIYSKQHIEFLLIRQK